MCACCCFMSLQASVLGTPSLYTYLTKLLCCGNSKHFLPSLGRKTLHMCCFRCSPCSLFLLSTTLGIFYLHYFGHFALCLSSWVGLSYKRDPSSLVPWHRASGYTQLAFHAFFLLCSKSIIHCRGLFHHAVLLQKITGLQLPWLTYLGMSLSQASCVQKDSMATLNNKQMLKVCALRKQHQNALRS